jgi:UDP-glucose 4-epimerase
LRLANVTGPGDRDRVIPLWLGRAARGEDIDLFGGDQILDFIPIDVVVDALLRAGETSLNGLPVNIGSGKGTSLRDLAARIRGLAGTHIDIRLLPARSVEVTRFVADVERMRTLLGLEPPTDPLVNLPELWNAAQSSARR